MKTFLSLRHCQFFNWRPSRVLQNRCTVALAGGYRQVAGGRWYWSHESGATQAEINIHLSMMSALSIYTVLMRTNSPKQPGCLQLIKLFGVYTLLSTVAGGAFVVCIVLSKGVLCAAKKKFLAVHNTPLLSSAPWCFEHCGIGRWLQTSGRWSVVLKSRIWSYPGGDKYSFVDDVCPHVSTLYWWGPTVRNSPVVYSW